VKIQIPFVTLILTIGFLFGAMVDFAFGDSDFTLELNDVNTIPIVTKFEVDGESYMQICPYAICKIEVIKSSFTPPNPDNRTMMMIAHSIDFDVKYNNTNTNEGHSKNIFLEKFSESMDECLIHNIIKDEEREIYFCHSGTDVLKRNSDSKSWYYESNGVYDVIKHTYTVKGDFKSDSS